LMAGGIVFGDKRGNTGPLFHIIESDRSRTLAAAQKIERGVDGSARKISFRIVGSYGRFLASSDPEENCLEHVLGISRTARHAISSAKNPVLMPLKQPLQAVHLRHVHAGLRSPRRPGGLGQILLRFGALGK